MTLISRARRSLIVGAGLAAVAIPALAQSPSHPRVATKKVKDHVGQVVTVCAKVVTHDCDSRTRSTTLDLEKPYWRDPVRIFISQEARARFPRRLEDRYVLGNICVTGLAERRDKLDGIVVDRPDQIVVTKAAPDTLFRPAALRPCDGNVEMPKVRREVKPRYSERAMRAKEQGRVFMEVVVGPEGRVGEGRLLVGFDPRNGLNDEAVKAVEQWQFTPGMFDGTAVPVIVTVELSFTLK
jgi:TonB family protein